MAYQKKEKEENFLRNEISLEDSVKANLIFKKFMTDNSYRELIASKFKFKYFEDFDISIATSLAIKYFNKYNRIPEVPVLKSVVKKALEKHDKYSEKLVNVSIETALNCDIQDEELIKNSVINFIASRTAFNLILNNIEKIKEQKDVSYILKELSDIENLRLDEDLGFQYFRQLQDHIEDLLNPEARSSTGYDQLDKVLEGGLLTKGRCLMCVAAAVHQGKSLMLSNLALNSLKNGKFVVVISLEMSELVYSSRIDAHLTGIDINQLQFNTDKLGERVSKFKKLHRDAELLIKEFPANTINARNLDAYLEKVERQFNRKIDIIYLDYLTLMNPVYGKDRNMYERGGEIAKDVRALSYKYACPIVTAVQTSRDTFRSDSIGMDNISESIAIAATADVIISLYASDEEKAMGIAHSTILKNRLGGHIGETLQWEIDYNNLRISTPINKNNPERVSEIKQITEDLIGDL